MKNLFSLTRFLSKNEILTAEEAKDIKGGRRFRAATYRKAIRKMNRLRSRGHHPTMTDQGDHYCIEW